MGKKFILLSILFTCIPLFLAFYEIEEYYSYKEYSTKKILKIEEEIQDTNQEINSEKEKIENIKIRQIEKVKILELWQKRLEQLKKDI